MSFNANWLALREPADAAARDEKLMREALAGASTAPLIVDLGCGTGSLTRALTRWAPAETRFRLVDYDPNLLAEAARRSPGAETRRIDLNRDVAAACEGADLIAASAFFDLASAAWIERLVAAIPPNAALYASLTYDGRQTWSPKHADDAAVLAAFHRHQRREKGFGPALGPAAGDALAAELRRAGRSVREADSAWRLSRPEHAALIDELADGVAAAVAEQGAPSAEWRAAARERCMIGHRDIFAAPTDSQRGAI